MKLLLLPHPLRAETVAFCAELAGFLKRNGHTACALPDGIQPLRQAGADLPAFDGQADLAAVAGGDGAVLRSVRALLAYDLPVWAVNFGRVGYLTDCEPADAFASFRKLLAGDCLIERRILLEGEAENPGEPPRRFLALNEAVIHRSALSRALRLELSVDQNLLQTFPADGLIVATPTGSTAYNLSAGGPILMPESGNLVVTPVCPYTLNNRSLVVPGTDTVGVRVSLPPPEGGGEDGLPLLTADGCEKLPLRDGALVTVRQAEKTFRLVRTSRDSFCRTLQQKLARTL